MSISSGIFRSTPYWLGLLFAGQFFKVHQRFSIGGGNTAYIQAKTNSRLTHIVSRSMGYDGAGAVVVSVLENPTITDGTTAPTIVQGLNRLSTKTPTTIFYNNPTGISGGTLIDRDVIFSAGTGGNAVASFSSANWERILPKSSDIVWEITNEAGTTADFVFDMVFYESGN